MAAPAMKTIVSRALSWHPDTLPRLMGEVDPEIRTSG
jgi:hypothetical protein